MAGQARWSGPLADLLLRRCMQTAVAAAAALSASPLPVSTTRREDALAIVPAVRRPAENLSEVPLTDHITRARPWRACLKLRVNSRLQSHTAARKR
jgi:hypothetical protein